MNKPSNPNPSEQGVKRADAAAITKAGSRQTYYTFKILADRDRVDNAFRAYAYFRWLDDLLDCTSTEKTDKTALLESQQTLLDECYRGETPAVSPEEQMLVDMVRSDPEEHSGLEVYLRNMMAVMAFDVQRCGRSISQAELAEYSRLLSTAVTEVLFYLIGHHQAPKAEEGRYQAVFGAHVVHMLRDMLEDSEVGYVNIPIEAIEPGHISPKDTNSLPMRKWVYERVELAHSCFKTGRDYIARVKNFRCRLAGFAYLARFEYVLRLIEKDQYCLRLEYPERKSLHALLWMMWRVLASSIKLPLTRSQTANQPALTDQCEEG